MTTTIVTSAYNTKPEYLSQLWESIKNQTTEDWRWVIRDDGSDEPVGETVDVTGARVHLIRGPNIGRGASMAVLMARPEILTDWVLHVDADDWLEPDAVECVAAAAKENPEASLIYADHWCHRLNRVDNGLQQPSTAEDLLHGSRMFHLIAMNMHAYRKTEGYNPDLRWSSDYDVWLKLQEVDLKGASFEEGGAKTSSFHHLPRQLYNWREHLDQMYHNYRDEQIFAAYKASKAACVRRGLKLQPHLTWHLNPVES